VPESGIINYAIRDTDSDGIKNYLELDSDNDGCMMCHRSWFTDLMVMDYRFNLILKVPSRTTGYTVPNTNNYITYAPVTTQ
jgi:hypothetical protein